MALSASIKQQSVAAAQIQNSASNQRSKSYKFSEIHQNLELNHQIQSKNSANGSKVRQPATAPNNKEQLIQGPVIKFDPKADKNLQLKLQSANKNVQKKNVGSIQPVNQQQSKPQQAMQSKPMPAAVHSFQPNGKPAQSHHSQQPSLNKSNFQHLLDQINFKNSYIAANTTFKNVSQVNSPSVDASSQANVTTSGFHTASNTHVDNIQHSNATVITRRRTHVRQQTINIQNPQFIVQIQNCNLQQQQHLDSLQIGDTFQSFGAPAPSNDSSRPQKMPQSPISSAGPTKLQGQSVVEMAKQKEEMSSALGALEEDSEPKDKVVEQAMTSTGTKIVGKVQEVKLERPESKVEQKKKKVVQFELSSASFSRSQPTDTEPSQSYTESVSDLNKFKKTPSREVDQSAENEGSIEEIDDQFQSFRISPSRQQSSEVTITNDRSQSQSQLQVLHQDLTPQKIESGLGNIGSIRSSDGMNSRQVQSTAALEKADQCDQDEVAPQTGPTTSQIDLQRIESQKTYQIGDQNQALPAMNIQAAMASIMKQENDERIERERQQKRFELSAAEEKYLELKILEILERNKKKQQQQQNNQSFSQKHSSQPTDPTMPNPSATSTTSKVIDPTESDILTAQNNTNSYDPPQELSSQQADQQIGQIIGGQKQRSRMKDNIYRIGNKKQNTVEDRNTNNIGVMESSQQSCGPSQCLYHNGSKKPPIHCMTMTQTLLGKPQKTKKIGEVSSHITGSKSSQHSRKETSCNIDVSSIQPSLSPPQNGVEKKGTNAKKLKIKKLKSANNQSMSSEFQNLQIIASKLQKGMEELSVTHNQSCDPNIEAMKHTPSQPSAQMTSETHNPNARMSPSGATAHNMMRDLMQERQIHSTQNVQAHSQEEILKQAQKSQNNTKGGIPEEWLKSKETECHINANFITRDAKNVFDKKKQRFEKIRKMRGQSEEGQSTSIEHSMQLINENYKLKGPSSTSLGAGGGNVRTSMNQFELEKLIQLSDGNNIGSSDSQDTPKLGAAIEPKDVNKTKFMRISENQSEETSQEFASRAKLSEPNTHSKKKQKVPQIPFLNQALSVKDQFDCKSDNSIYGNPDITSTSSLNGPKNEVKSPKILQNQPRRKMKAQKNNRTTLDRSPQRVQPLNTTKHEDVKKKLLANQISFLHNSQQRQQKELTDDNSTSTNNNNYSNYNNLQGINDSKHSYFLAPSKSNPRASLKKMGGQVQESNFRFASKSIGSQGKESTSTYSMQENKSGQFKAQVVKTTNKQNQIQLSIPAQMVAKPQTQQRSSESRQRASPQTIQLKLVKKNTADYSKTNSLEKKCEKDDQLSKDSVIASQKQFKMKPQGTDPSSRLKLQYGYNQASKATAAGKATIMILPQNQKRTSNKLPNDFNSCVTTKFEGNASKIGKGLVGATVSGSKRDEDEGQLRYGEVGKYTGKRKGKGKEKNQSVDNSQMQRWNMKDFSNNKQTLSHAKEGATQQSSGNAPKQIKASSKTSVATKAPTPAPIMNAISSIADSLSSHQQHHHPHANSQIPQSMTNNLHQIYQVNPANHGAAASNIEQQSQQIWQGAPSDQTPISSPPGLIGSAQQHGTNNKKKLKVLSVNFIGQDDDTGGAAGGMNCMQYLNMIKGGASQKNSSVVAQQSVVQELSSCEEDNGSKKGVSLTKKSNLKTIGKQYMVTSSNLKKAQQAKQKQAFGAARVSVDHDSGQLKTKNLSQVYYYYQNQSQGNVGSIDKPRQTIGDGAISGGPGPLMMPVGANPGQKRRQKSHNNNTLTENGKTGKMKSQKAIKDMVAYNNRKGSMYVDNSLDQNLKLTSIQDVTTGSNGNINLDKVGSRGSIQSLNNFNMNAAGLIYYKNADTSVMNRPQQSISYLGPNDSSGATVSFQNMTRTKPNPIKYQSVQNNNQIGMRQAKESEHTMQQPNFSFVGSDMPLNIYNSAEFNEPPMVQSKKMADINSQGAHSYGKLHENHIDSTELLSRSPHKVSQEPYYSQGAVTESLSRATHDQVSHQRVQKRGVQKKSNDPHQGPKQTAAADKDTFFNLLEISKQTESLPQNQKKQLMAAKGTKNNGAQGVTNGGQVPQSYQYFKIMHQNNSIESLKSSSIEASWQPMPVSASAYQSQPVNKKKIKFLKKPPAEKSISYMMAIGEQDSLYGANSSVIGEGSVKTAGVMDLNRYSIESLNDAISQQRPMAVAKSIQNSKTKGDQYHFAFEQKSDRASSKNKLGRPQVGAPPLKIDSFKDKMDHNNFFLQNSAVSNNLKMSERQNSKNNLIVPNQGIMMNNFVNPQNVSDRHSSYKYQQQASRGTRHPDVSRFK